MNPWNKLTNTDKKDENRLDATYEQLSDCVSLLALSVAQHRGKFGVVPLENTADKLGDNEQEPVTAESIAEGRKTLEEALALIKTASNKQSEKTAPKITLEEKRQQVRINVAAPIHVMPHDSDDKIKATLANISWGGATLQTDQPVGEAGSFINIELPSFKHYQIMVKAQILRVSDEQNRLTYNTRFSRLRTADEEVFEQLLEFLAGSGDNPGQRKSARLAQRIEIQYDDASELQASLENISSGGLGITVPEPMELNQSLLAVISSTDGKCQLLLRARVVRQEEIDSSSFRIYRVGLEFEHPTDDLKDRVKELIQKMGTDRQSNKFRLK